MNLQTGTDSKTANASNAPPEDELVRLPQIYQMTIDYILIWIELIWYYRGLYPAESFKAKQAFYTKVYQNRHPDLQAYLDDLRGDLMDLLQNGQLCKIHLRIFEHNKVIESYTINVINSPILYESFALEEDVIISNEDYPLAMIYAEFQASLNSLISELSGISNQYPVSQTQEDDNYKFKIYISPNAGTNDLYSKLVVNANWTLTSRRPQNAPVHLNRARAVDLGFLNIQTTFNIRS
ncbi:DNA polymerase zeta processivity subunit [Komagataella phaffii CBS 7435]|uniref:HORMA domain-containing protein n=2 Tax=Komagataella phaffii TaxID=460519 RepID=C4R6X7_KOMPG|nr:Hypothetical protein PAS_chr4_0125 [Komagataella phaffii GS115]AOA65189.1 GQ67_04434T0 [Komagataella phaffii]CAH2451303.1 DNA binding protein [Komagataella phaffii CBS 7435]AOA69832.1 GQ68_04406T0 [Komagataella phaffii GS115]CAY71352.1 Hypothetical protein PAS_chr4_0125 [Komagataella phaffii GS115]CCA41042.1 DNA polymerase zeta processivity subunit [Komagataella phaffii CBS 7435]